MDLVANRDSYGQHHIPSTMQNQMSFIPNYNMHSAYNMHHPDMMQGYAHPMHNPQHHQFPMHPGPHLPNQPTGYPAYPTPNVPSHQHHGKGAPTMQGYHSGNSDTSSPDLIEKSPTSAPASEEDYGPPLTPPPQRERFSYTRYQLELMNGIYKTVRYPNPIQKQLIAKRVGITKEQVKIWFQNRRRKDVVASQNPEQPIKEDGRMSDIGMVDESVVAVITSELVKFEKDPKGKKMFAKAELKQRCKPYERPVEQSKTFVPPNVVAPSSKKNASKPTSGMEGLMAYTGHHTTPGMVNGNSGQEQIVPSSDQIDMVSPPNTVAPSSNDLSFKRTNSTGSSGCAANIEPVELEKRRTSNSSSPDHSVHASSPSSSNASPQGLPVSIHAPIPQYGSSWHRSDGAPPIPGVIDFSSSLPIPEHNNLAPLNQPSALPDYKQFNLDRVFPFPMTAEPPMMLPPTQFVDQHNRDSYQQLLISSYPNPTYFNG